MKFTKVFVLAGLLSGVVAFAPVQATMIVRYDADVLPELNATPFDFTPPRTDLDSGTRTLSDGILTIQHDGPSGSFEHTRTDEFLDSDLAVFQVRARYVETIEEYPDLLSAGALWVRWSGEIGGFIFYFTEDRVALRIGYGGVKEFPVPFDTSEFHTYTIVKNRRENVQLYTDGDLALTIPLSEFAGGNSVHPFQTFYSSMQSITQWDFVNYAIGERALDAIPIPEPSSWIMLFLAVGSLSARHSWSRRC